MTGSCILITPLPFLCLTHYHFSILMLLFDCSRMSLSAPACFGACCSRACSCWRQRHPEPGVRDHRAPVCAPGLLCQLVRAPERGDLLEGRGDSWGLVRLATVGKEGKVRSVSAEGVSYQMREGKGTGRQKGSFEG